MRLNKSPNHALQRTAPCVTAPASAAAFPPTMQVPRHTPRSLSLGSFNGVRNRGGILGRKATVSGKPIQAVYRMGN